MPLDPHECGDVGGLSATCACRASISAHAALHLFGAALKTGRVVFQDAEDVVARRPDERSGELEPSRGAEVLLDLRDLETPGEKVLPRVERRRVIAIVVVEEEGDAVLRQKRHELGVHVDLPEAVDRLGALDGERDLLAGRLPGGCSVVACLRTWRPRWRGALQAQRVLPPAQAAVAEEVVGALHDGVRDRWTYKTRGRSEVGVEERQWQ